MPPARGSAEPPDSDTLQSVLSKITMAAKRPDTPAKTLKRSPPAPPSSQRKKATRASAEPQKRPGRPAKAEVTDLRGHILGKAIDLFAAQGLHTPSVRDVTQAANVNVALVRYYFGSKQGLLEAVIRSTAGLIMAERHRLLDECVIRPRGTGKEYVHQVITAYVIPVMALSASAPNGPALSRIIGLAWADPDPTIRELMDYLFNGAALRLVAILRTACPHVGATELNWRAACLFSAIYTLYTDPGRMRNMVGAKVNVKDKDALLNYVVPFLVAGMTHA